MKLNKLKCPKCDSQDFSGFAKGDHIGIRCRDCGAHVKWSNKEERKLLEDYGNIVVSTDPHATIGDIEPPTAFKLDLILDRIEVLEGKVDQLLPKPRKEGSSDG